MTKEEIIQMLKDNPIKEINLVGKNLLEGTYFDGNGIPKMIGITKAEYLEYKKSKDNWDKLKRWIKVRESVGFLKISIKDIICEMQVLEGSDSNVND